MFDRYVLLFKEYVPQPRPCKSSAEDDMLLLTALTSAVDVQGGRARASRTVGRELREPHSHLLVSINLCLISLTILHLKLLNRRYYPLPQQFIRSSLVPAPRSRHKPPNFQQGPSRRIEGSFTSLFLARAKTIGQLAQTHASALRSQLPKGKCIAYNCACDICPLLNRHRGGP